MEWLQGAGLVVSGFLIVATFLAGAISGLFGVGGGTLLLAVLASFLPVSQLIPIHGVIQFFSTGSRAISSFKKIEWSIVWKFCIGAVLAALIGRNLIISLPEEIFRLIIGMFILLATWVRLPIHAGSFRAKFFVIGFIGEFLSLFVGAVAPFVDPFYLNEKMDRFSLVATKTMNMSIIHLIKVLTYLSLGFNPLEEIDLLTILVVVVIAGTYLGKMFLKKIPEKKFFLLLKLMLTLLAIRLIYISVLEFL